MNNDVKALKSGIWYTAASFLTKSIGLITTPIFTRMLSHAEFGLYSNYQSWLSILSLVVTLNLGSTFISARYDYEDRFDEYILSTLALGTFSVLLWTVVLNIAYPFIASVLGVERIYLNCMMLYLLMSSAVSMYQTRERYYFEYKKTVLISVIISVGTSVVSVILVLLMDNRLAGRIYGSALPTILTGLVLYNIIVLKGKKITLTDWVYAIPICLPFIPHLLSMTILGSVDRIMITNICGEEDNALYSVAYTCGSLITILITSMNTAYAPWLGEKLHQDKYNEVRSFSIKYITAFVYLMLGAMLLTPEMLMLLGGKSYMAAKTVMPPVTCGVACQFLYTMFVNVEQFKKKTLGMAIGSMSAALLNYILNAIFIPRFGYTAAAYTTLFSYLWLLCVHMFLVYRIGYHHVYDYRFVTTIVGLLLIVTLGVNLLYRSSEMRYVFVVCYIFLSLLVIYKYGRRILQYYHDMKR